MIHPIPSTTPISVHVETNTLCGSPSGYTPTATCSLYDAGFYSALTPARLDGMAYLCALQQGRAAPDTTQREEQVPVCYSLYRPRSPANLARGCVGCSCSRSWLLSPAVAPRKRTPFPLLTQLTFYTQS